MSKLPLNDSNELTLESNIIEETNPLEEIDRLPLFSSIEQRIINAYGKLRSLKLFKNDLEIRINARDLLIETESHSKKSEEEIIKKIDQLKKEMRIVVGNDLIKNQALDMSSHSMVTLKALYNQQDDSNRLLLDLLQQRDGLATKFLRYHHEIQKLEQEYIQLQKQTLEHQEENKQLMKEIKKLEKNDQYDEEQLTPLQTDQLENLREQYRRARQRREIVRNVLMGIILESGISWTEDDELLKLMFMLGDTPLPQSM